MDICKLKRSIGLGYIRKRYRLVYILLLFFSTGIAFPNFLPAQIKDYEFEHLSSTDGLSQSSVLKIFQDSRNFLWFATFDGLNRYDGYNFKIYRSSITDTTAISGQGFNSICEDHDGNLWIGSLDGGLNKYDSKTDTFKKYKFNPKDSGSLCSNFIRTLCIDSKGNLWIGTLDGLDQLNTLTEKITHYKFRPNDSNSISNNFVHTIVEDSNNNLWIGTSNGLNRFNLITKKIVQYYKDISKPYYLFSDYINRLFLDKENNLWISTGEGLHLYDYKNNKFIRYLSNDKITNRTYDKNIMDFCDDGKGKLWLATYHGGLSVFDTREKIFTNYRNNPYNSHSLSNNCTLSIYEDRSGTTWIGTDGGGVNKLNLRKEQFNNYSVKPGELNSLSNNSIYSFYEDNSGVILITTFGGGINLFHPGRDKSYFTKMVHEPGNNNSLIDDEVRNICKDHEGNYWIGTQNGLDKYNPKNRRFFHYNIFNTPELKVNNISTLLNTSSNELWIGTYYGGVTVYDNRKGKFTNFMNNPDNPTSLSGNTVRKIYEDHSGIIWICTNNGLDRFDSEKDQFIHYQNNFTDNHSLAANNILNIFQDHTGTLWVGTNLGLNKMTGDIKNNRNIEFIRYSMKDGLPDNNIQALIEDSQGNLWIGTNNGLSKFNPQKGTFKNYTKDDGLPSNEFYINSCIKKKSSGELLFGGYNGFCFFNPDSIKDDIYIPPVILTNFYLSNALVKTNTIINGEVILKNTIWTADKINLSYKHNIIAFEFSALDYASPGGNKYAYIMEGLETEWNYIGNRHFVSFTNLPPGEYLFKVKAANASGIWNNNGVSLKVIVLPPYWQTWWFRFICIVLLGSTIFISFKRKIRNFEKRKKELENLILEKSVLNDHLQSEIIEHQKTEIALKSAKEEAEKSDKLKSEFLAQMSHEIRTPINAILSFSSLMREDVAEYLSDDIKDGFSIIDTASKRLIRTVDLILNMSVLQTDSIELSFQQFDFYEKILAKKIQEYSIPAKAKGLNFTVIKKADNCAIYSDETIIDQIFDNLLNNAVKFTKQGEISINIFPDNFNHLVVEINDTGVGISEEYMSNLFKPFLQEESGYARRFEGNGLGLALTKKYCDLTNIEITVESKKGYGTKVTLKF